MSASDMNPVIKRIAARIKCSFASPALIGCGFGDNTDSDIIRYADGAPYIPGSSIAGVLLSLCPQAKSHFGSQDSISPLWVFDAELDDATIIELDGVALDRENKNKVALDESKYDYEAVSIGAGFTIRLLLTIRQNESGNDYESSLKELIGALKSGCVRFGAKTKRGFGCVKFEMAQKREFDLSEGKTENLLKWIDFDWCCEEGWDPADSNNYTTDSSTLSVKLFLDGSIMIRDTRNIYEDIGESEEAPDYKHISIGGMPIILGTSWAGAFRSGLYKLLDPQFRDRAKAYLDEVFGFVRENEKEVAVSQVTFDASCLIANDTTVEGYRSITRVKIDRFTGGAADGALFTEKPWYGGETTLDIHYPKGREDIKELLLLGLEGFNMRLMQIGGEASIGRGFISVDTITIDGEKSSDVLGKPKKSLIAAIQKAGETA